MPNFVNHLSNFTGSITCLPICHYPSDVIGAMLLAYAWVQVAEWLYVWFAPILKRWKFVANSEV